ncbi:MAG: 16S rRNA (guanine(966)-N(2))-methyltransferase RsmD [Thiomargarita sp.]|nr:16S rRNA (guanine(966)-N(2))-methyltransferase RsmD [Thiomargarita sp.]
MKGKIRIIGGKWRGRKLQVSDELELRPTPNRVRETLFNWLAMYLPNSCCLDLFAGSGILGIEAVSRSANSAILVEQKSSVVKNLKQQIAKLNTEQLEIIQADALNYLITKNTTTFDIVFLDPPFTKNLLETTCKLLEQHKWLNSPAYIYLETATYLNKPVLPSHWKIIRQQTAGQVSFFLIQN